MTGTKTCDICGKDKPVDGFSETRFIEANTEKEINICIECE